MPTPPAGLAVLAAMAISAAPAVAAASADTPLVVRVGSLDCAAAPAFATFLDSLRVELAAHGPPCCTVEAEDPTAAGGGPVTLSIEPCDASAESVAVSVADRVAGRTIQRRIAFTDVAPAARPRALALAVAELVRSAREPPAALAAPAPTVPAGGGATRAPVVAGASADLLLRVYPAHRTTLWGGRLALSLLRDRWRAELDLDAASGERGFDIGTIGVRLVSAGLAVGPRFDLGSVTLDLGLCGVLGWARIDGRSAQPGVAVESGSGVAAMVGARVGLEAPATRSVRVGALVEAGATARSLTGDVNGAPAAGISGEYLLLAIGVGLFHAWAPK